VAWLAILKLRLSVEKLILAALQIEQKLLPPQSPAVAAE
jgi:hypothetical protein